jgi:hypothetical protein
MTGKHGPVPRVQGRKRRIKLACRQEGVAFSFIHGSCQIVDRPLGMIWWILRSFRPKRQRSSWRWFRWEWNGTATQLYWMNFYDATDAGYRSIVANAAI